MCKNMMLFILTAYGWWISASAMSSRKDVSTCLATAVKDIEVFSQKDSGSCECHAYDVLFPCRCSAEPFRCVFELDTDIWSKKKAYRKMAKAIKLSVSCPSWHNKAFTCMLSNEIEDIGTINSKCRNPSECSESGVQNNQQRKDVISPADNIIITDVQGKIAPSIRIRRHVIPRNTVVTDSQPLLNDSSPIIEYMKKEIRKPLVRSIRQTINLGQVQAGDNKHEVNMTTLHTNSVEDKEANSSPERLVRQINSVQSIEGHNSIKSVNIDEMGVDPLRVRIARYTQGSRRFHSINDPNSISSENVEKGVKSSRRPSRQIVVSSNIQFSKEQDGVTTSAPVKVRKSQNPILRAIRNIIGLDQSGEIRKLDPSIFPDSFPTKDKDTKIQFIRAVRHIFRSANTESTDNLDELSETFPDPTEGLPKVRTLRQVGNPSHYHPAAGRVVVKALPSMPNNAEFKVDSLFSERIVRHLARSTLDHSYTDPRILNATPQGMGESENVMTIPSVRAVRHLSEHGRRDAAKEMNALKNENIAAVIPAGRAIRSSTGRIQSRDLRMSLTPRVRRRIDFPVARPLPYYIHSSRCQDNRSSENENQSYGSMGLENTEAQWLLAAIWQGVVHL